MGNFKKINLDDFEEFGAGATAASYNCITDTSVMLKLYFPDIDESIPMREKELSDTVASLGIPSAPALELVECAGRKGVTFKRITGKKSISRLIADDPENIEKYVNTFAAACRSVHSSSATGAALPSRIRQFREMALDADLLSHDEKIKVIRFLDSADNAETCLHGDMGPTNLVIAQGKEYWIDVADFSYGDPFFDIGTLYAILFALPPDRLLNNQHLSEAQAALFWDYFVKAYLSYDVHQKSFGPSPCADEICAFTLKARLFSIFAALFFYSHIGETPWIRKIFDQILPLI